MGKVGEKRGGRRTCGSREDAAIGLHDGEQLVVAVQLEVGDVGRWAAVNDELVEDLELFTLLHVLALAVAVHGAGEAHAEADAHPVVAHDFVEVFLVALELEVGQEAEAAEAEGENRRDDALEEPRGEEHGAVTAEGEHQVELLRLAPAEIRRPVLEHVLVPWLGLEQTRGVETLGAS